MMYIRKTRILSVAITVLILIYPGLISGCEFDEIDEIEMPWDQSPEFEIESFILNPGGIMVGDYTTAKVTVANKGNDAGMYTAILLMEGSEVDSKNAWIEPETSKDIRFKVHGEKAGSFKFSVEKHSDVLSVFNWNPGTNQYDSGVSLGTYYATGDLGHIVHFKPESKPYKINKITVYGTATLADPKEFDTRQFTVRIWNNDKDQILWTQDFPWRLFEGPAKWVELDVPDIKVNNDFHVELVTYSGEKIVTDQYALGNISIGWEKAVSANGSQAQKRSGWSIMGVITKAPGAVSSDLNWLIRVEGEGSPKVLKYDDGEDEEWHWTTASHFINFSPPSVPYEIQKILIYGYINGTYDPEDRMNSFIVRIRDLSNMNILWEQDFKWDLFGRDKAKWVTINVPGISCSGDFCVRLITNSKDEDDCIVIGVDCSNPNRHSYVSREVLLQPGESGREKGAEYDSDSSNWMIRVEGVYK